MALTDIRRQRFALVLALLMLAGFALTSLLSFWAAKHTLGLQISESTLPLTSDNIYSEIQQDLLLPVFIASLMAQDTFLRDWLLDGERDEDPIRRYLAEIQQRYDTITTFLVSESSRRYYHSSGLLKTVSANETADSWYFRASALPADQDYEINVDWDTADRSRLTVFVNYQVRGYNDELLGITGVGLALNKVTRLLQDYQERWGRRVYFVDMQGEVTLHGGGMQGLTSIRGEAPMATLADAILTKRSGSYEYRRDNQTVYLNSRHVPEFNWVLIVEQHQQQAMPELVRSLLINLAISVVLCLLVLWLVNLALGGYQRRLETMASTDKLTGALSRQVFDGIFDQAVHSARRSGQHLSLIMLDLDRFKALNDRHGHLAGDLGLKWLVERLRESVREADSICRWGGDEFLVLLPDCDLEQANALYERIDRSMSRNTLTVDGSEIDIGVSAGIAQWQVDERPVDTLNRADRELLRIKSAARNARPQTQ